MATPLPLKEQEEYDTETRQARAALGETVFVATLAEGRAMTWEQATAYALEEAAGDFALQNHAQGSQTIGKAEDVNGSF